MNVENLNAEVTASANFLENIKNKTSVLHQKLESLPISKCIVNPEVTIKEYAMYLTLMLDVVQGLEDKIFPLVADVIPRLNERKKLPLINNDLEFVSSQSKVCVALFDISEKISIPFAMGIVYVIEGSTLGGRFILKNIHENLGFDKKNGASYFAAYGNKTGTKWKEFLQILTEYEGQTNSEDEIIAGALYAFEIIHNHFLKNIIN